ncbi:MAG TPA: hypothetical protein PKJ37_12110 [Acidobacteriota bacterium]|nr:hypothetical protein [Acidobacteriota bacterium]HNT18622.1 hypothetical protein [Acidobacteriota bacterium]
MPKYSRKFKSPAHITAEIMDEKLKKFGTIRIKPVSVSWKQPNERRFYTVSLEEFISWIMSNKKSKRGKS